MRIRILDQHWKKNPDPVQEHYFKIYNFFLTEEEFINNFSSFFANIFSFRASFFIISLFQQLHSGLNFLKHFLIDILTLESEDQHIFADPNPGVRSWPISQRFLNPLN